jgi:hypothetical protein
MPTLQVQAAKQSWLPEKSQVESSKYQNEPTSTISPSQNRFLNNTKSVVIMTAIIALQSTMTIACSFVLLRSYPFLSQATDRDIYFETSSALNGGDFKPYATVEYTV